MHESSQAELKLGAEVFEAYAAGATEGQISTRVGIQADDVAKVLYQESARRRAEKTFRERCRERPLCKRKHGLDALLPYVPECRLDASARGKASQE